MNIRSQEKGVVQSRTNKLILLIFICSMILRFAAPPQILLGTSFDDWLGIQQARSILEGNWLGPWDNRTFIKTPGYSIFLAFSNFSGVNPTTLIHFIYLLACLLTLKLMLIHLPEKRRNNQAKVIYFSVLAFNPLLFSAEFSRIYRNGLYTVLVFLAIICFLIGLTSFFKGHDRKVRQIESNAYLLFAALCFGYVMIIRQDSFYIFFLLMSIYIFLATRRLAVLRNSIVDKKTQTENARKKKWKNIVVTRQIIKKEILILSVMLFGLIALYMVPSEVVKGLNYSKYGVEIVEDYNSGPFSSSLRRWSSVQPRSETRLYVPVSENQRKLIYEVSPQARKLQPYLEGKKDTWQKITSCSQGVACDDSAAWITYEIRDAVVELGLAKNAIEFEKFFVQLDSELKVACEKNLVDCSKPGISTGIQPINAFTVTDVSRGVGEALNGFLQNSYSFVSPNSNPEINSSIGDEWREVIVYPDSIWSVTDFNSNLIKFLKLWNILYMFLQTILALWLVSYITVSGRGFFKKIKESLISILVIALHVSASIFAVSLASLSFGVNTIDRGYLLSPKLEFLVIQIILFSQLMGKRDEGKRGTNERIKKGSS